MTRGRFAPVFVVGAGRSGTSLVHAMLAAHSGLALPPETGFARRYVGRGRLARRHARGGAPAVRELLEADERVGRLGLDLDRVLARYRDGAPFSEADLYETLLTTYAETLGRPRAGDKDPRLVEFLPLLARHWPAAHVVHVVRDPRDVLASKKKAAWSRRRSAAAHVFATRVQVRAARRDGPRLFGPHYHEVVYEALLADPAVVLRELTRRLGLPYEAGMLDFADAARALVAADEMAWKRETLRPLLTANTGKWRRELSPREAALAERVCPMGGTVAADGGGAARAPSPAGRLAVACLAALLRLLEWPYRVWRRGTLLLRRIRE